MVCFFNYMSYRFCVCVFCIHSFWVAWFIDLLIYDDLCGNFIICRREDLSPRSLGKRKVHEGCNMDLTGGPLFWRTWNRKVVCKCSGNCVCSTNCSAKSFLFHLFQIWNMSMRVSNRCIWKYFEYARYHGLTCWYELPKHQCLVVANLIPHYNVITMNLLMTNHAPTIFFFPSA